MKQTQLDCRSLPFSRCLFFAPSAGPCWRHPFEMMWLARLLLASRLHGWLDSKDFWENLFFGIQLNYHQCRIINYQWLPFIGIHRYQMVSWYKLSIRYQYRPIKSAEVFLIWSGPWRSSLKCYQQKGHDISSWFSVGLLLLIFFFYPIVRCIIK